MSTMQSHKVMKNQDGASSDYYRKELGFNPCFATKLNGRPWHSHYQPSSQSVVGKNSALSS